MARSSNSPSPRERRMKVALLSAGRGWHTDELTRALGDRGHEARLLPIQSLIARIGGEPRLGAGPQGLDDCDAVLVRIIPRGSLEQMVFRIDALHWLERLGVVVLNPAAAIERTVDKFYTSALLEHAGVPTPRTVVAEGPDAAMAAFQSMGDVIVKPLFGSNGRGMVRVSDEEIAYRVFKALELERAVYYVQEALPHEGRDVRAFVVGDRVVAAAWRTAPGWRTNVARGGRTEKADLPPAWEALCLRASRAVGAEYSGVDLLPTTDGRLFVLEVNGIPGWRGLQATTEVDVAASIVRHLEDVAGRAR
jgi:RimK family alpha-L-glutamate ligase